MNLELLFRGASWTDQPLDAAEWEARAADHASVTRLEHVRSDGSTYHWVDFNPSTGAVINKGSHQGAGPESTWARGQAWGLYGYAKSYRWTGDPQRLLDAVKLADYFVENLPGDFVPYWDFEAAGIPNEPHESSAAAVAAAGLLSLSTLVSDPADRDRYFEAAESILISLMSPAYLATGVESSGILLHGMRAQPTATEMDVSLIYGDYYFVEALLRYLDLTAPSVPAMSTGSLGLAALVMLTLGACCFPAPNTRRRGPHT